MKYILILITLLILTTTYIFSVITKANKRELLIKFKYAKNRNIWQTAPAKVDNQVKNYMNTWKNIPNWKYRFMNDNQVNNVLIKAYPQLNFTKIFEEKPIVAYDLFRYAIIFSEGGLYIDSDVAKEDSFESSMVELSGCNVIIGIETDAREKSDYYLRLARNYQFIQWTFYANKHHPLMKLAVERIARKVEYYQINNITLANKDVFEVSGPGIWTDVVLDYLTLKYGVNLKKLAECGSSYKFGDVCILNTKAFEPYQSHSCSRSASRRNSFVLNNHYYWGSWKKNQWSFEEKEDIEV